MFSLSYSNFLEKKLIDLVGCEEEIRAPKVILAKIFAHQILAFVVSLSGD